VSIPIDLSFGITVLQSEVRTWGKNAASESQLEENLFSRQHAMDNIVKQIFQSSFAISHSAVQYSAEDKILVAERLASLGDEAPENGNGKAGFGKQSTSDSASGVITSTFIPGICTAVSR